MTNRTSFLAASVSAFALLATAPAFAQDNDDVIIVSATKRNTTLQETPVAVTVTSSDVIEKAQILDIKDLQSVVPTFRVSQLQNTANTSLSIRGFGNGGNNIGIEPAVGVFIDGVYRSRAAAVIGDLPKLERVEVLSGPQSTLFGKNASAGVVSVVTAKPDFESNGYIEGGIGNFNQVYGKGYISGGITDDLAVSLGGGFQKRDGYFENLDQASDFNNIKRFNLRGQALWTPSDNAEFRLIVDKSVIDENCCGTGVIIDGPFAAGQPNVGDIIRSLGGNQPSADNQFSYETYANSNSQNEIEDRGISLQSDFKFGNFDLTSITAYRANNSDYGSDSDYNSLIFLENVFQDVKIKTFTQELRVDTSFGDKVDVLLGGYYFNEQITQNSGIEYGRDTRTYIDLLAGGPSTLAGIEDALGFARGTFFAEDQRVLEEFTQDDEAFSIFGQLDFKVSDRLTATIGANYTEDAKKVSATGDNTDVFGNLSLNGEDGRRILTAGGLAANFPAVAASCGLGQLAFSAANVGQVLGAPACFIDAMGNTAPGSAVFAGFQQQVAAGVAAIPDAVLNDPAANPLGGLFGLQFQPQLLDFPNSVESGRTNDDDLTYTARLAYEVNDNFNVYGSYATGFKSSSWNFTRDSRPFLADAAALQAAGLLPNNYVPSTGREFGTRFALPESADVFEIGLKARFEWGAFNIAAFDQTIENFQSTIFNGTGFVLANAESQSTKGIEFDSTFDPIDSLRLTFAGVLLDPIYDSFEGASGPGGTVVDLSGERPAGISEVSLSTSATYTQDLGNGAEGFIRADYQYESDVQIVDNIAGVNRSTNIINGSIGVTLDSGLGVQAWVRNLNKDQSYTSTFPGVVQGATVNGYPSQPRTYGVSLRKSF
jgi:outer membrane receptor protein involved in Fe transport